MFYTEQHAPKAAERCVPRTNFSGIRRVHELGSPAAGNAATNSSLRPNHKRQPYGLLLKPYELLAGRTNRPVFRAAATTVQELRSIVHDRSQDFFGVPCTVCYGLFGDT